MSYLEMSLFERTMQGLCSCSLILCWVLNKKKSLPYDHFQFFCILYHNLWEGILFQLYRRFRMEILVLHDWAILTYFTCICLLLEYRGNAQRDSRGAMKTVVILYRSKFWEKLLRQTNATPVVHLVIHKSRFFRNTALFCRWRPSLWCHILTPA